MSKRRFKKCVAENGCGHIYDAQAKCCPKCDSKDYKIGFYSKSGNFMTEEQEAKRLQASIERSRAKIEKCEKEVEKYNQEISSNSSKSRSMTKKEWVIAAVFIIVVFMAVMNVKKCSRYRQMPWRSDDDSDSQSSSACDECGSSKGYQMIGTGIPPRYHWECKSCRAIR